MNSRRNFLKNASGVVAACVAGTACASLLQSCGSLEYLSVAEHDGKLSVGKDEFKGKPYVIVKTPGAPFPVYLSHSAATEKGAENYSALLMQCTHKQCEVKPAGTVLFCPCHFSEFSAAGKVLHGPASADLHKFNVTHDEKNVYIHLR